MKKICLSEVKAKALIWRFENFLQLQETEIRYLRKSLQEVKDGLKLKE